MPATGLTRSISSLHGQRELKAVHALAPSGREVIKTRMKYHLANLPGFILPGKREEKKMKKFVAILLAATMVLGLAACGGNGGNGGNGGGAAEKTSINVCIASEPQSLDPALNSAVDGATMLVHLFSGLAKWTKNGDAYEIVADMAEELVDPVDNGDGTFTYTYKIRDAKWSDGEPVKAADFEYGWKRATSRSDV